MKIVNIFKMLFYKINIEGKEVKILKQKIKCQQILEISQYHC